LIKVENINEYIDKIPPMADNLKSCIRHLKENNLTAAAKSIESDKALSEYLLNIVNKPIYGFKDKIKNTQQVFTILGIIKMKQLMMAYLVSLLSPAKWQVFKMNNNLFQDLQAELLANWNNILLKKYNIKEDEDFMLAATILSSTVIVCEELFKDNQEIIELLKSRNILDYNTILKKLTDMSIFDIAIQIGKKWEISQKTADILKASSGVVQNDSIITENGKFLHLLFFMELSKPKFIEAQLNDFIEFKIEFVEDIYEEFSTIFNIGEEE
jgi:HD-like signal output (HDOD) protein